MKLPHLILSSTLVASLVGLAGCTDRSSERHYVRDEVKNDGARTETREVYQQPGEIGKVESGKGSAEVQTRKEVIKTETGKATIPTVEEKHVKADINRMNDKDFEQMGMPRESAESVIRYRHEHGNFASVDELRNVPGLSTHWLNQMSSKLAVAG